jgi:anti-anti-sigma factor
MSRTWTIPGLERGSAVTEINCVLDDDPTQVIMSGEVDLLAKPALDAALQVLAAHPGKDAVIDLHAVTVLSCIGVRFLYAFAQQRRQRGGTVYVQVVPGPVDRILELLGVDEVATIVYHSPDRQ